MLRKLIEKYQKTNEVNRFLVKGAFLYIIWRIFRKYMMVWGQYEDFTTSFAKLYLKISNFFLHFAGVESFIDYDTKKLWVIGSEQSIEIVYDCLGTNLFFIFMIFIIAYPGKLLTKLWYIPSGIIAIFFLNAMRMSAMAYIADVNPKNFDVFHHFIFQGMIYICIFLMWWGFVKLSAKYKKV